ncbi:MAG TPA: hypothetical protein VLY24_14595, partial [Bryobacteraceae bacterium]|nr:hypothetical protein [Bryobacteraceae bacterium]
MTFSRLALATLLLVSAAAAQPPITTIQDVLYKADGTPFNGIVTISWPSFEASDLSEIAGQTITVQIENGIFRVQLVPNATTNPLVFYTAVYNSDGRVQFSESWSVPASVSSLRIRDVRAVLPIISSSSNDTTASGPVNESDVIGLVADLGSRPIKGPAYSAGRVALVNSLGSIDSVAGNSSDCVHVDGSTGSCGGGASPAYSDGEAPSGTINGVNATFTLANIPNPAASLALYRNGLLMQAGVDYTLSGQLIQFQSASIPVSGDTLLATYRLAGSASASSLLLQGPQVLCSSAGTSVNGTSFASMGTCTIPPATLQSGDRVAVRFDLQHQGTVSGYTFQVTWGSTTVLQRAGTPNDAQVTGRVDAGLDLSGAQVSSESWGTTLPLSATIGNATDAYATGLVVDFEGQLAVPGDTLTLRNYSLVRVP